MDNKDLMDLVYCGKQHRGYISKNMGYEFLGSCNDSYAQYSVYRAKDGQILYTRYCDMN